MAKPPKTPPAPEPDEAESKSDELRREEGAPAETLRRAEREDKARPRRGED